MLHALGIDFFDGPDIADVGRPKELVGSAFSPSEETPLMIPHEALSTEHWVHFVPDDLLREIQARGLPASPQRTRWSPTTHRSPGHVIASSGGAGTSSGSHRPSLMPGSKKGTSSPAAK